MTAAPPPEPTRSPAPAETSEEAAEAPGVPLLTQPADGVPDVVTTPEALLRTIEALAAGTGPVAVDAERAHGFRYSQRAYLLQLRRKGSGTHLIDPIAFGHTDDDGTFVAADLSELRRAIVDAEWVVHAASQDLPCLFEVGLLPTRIFDTELAARLLGYPRVALGTMVEQTFGVRLLKEHSAADWSTRPLPTDWLTYAALDVELLVELRDALAAQLDEQGKRAWAEEEFAALVAGAGAAPKRRTDPWRRTSGIHRVRTRRGLGLVAGLWNARDAIARQLDRAPGRILPDAAIAEVAVVAAPGRDALRRVPAFARRQAKRHESDWLAAIAAVEQTPDTELPALHLAAEGPPQTRVWASKNPEAASRLSRAREALAARAEELDLPVENLLTPDHVRRLAWKPPEELTHASVDAALAAAGARPWQRAQTVDLLLDALTEPQVTHE
ncbi:ribonuclease D [Microlunatus sagamiharensis]|uniref:Ribonuclease D n=1 Tax=Microlunatus sagamiharensis TaxID=546874 RepID=A0A1H2M1N6_9ACTN|nr:HRDC domain-containing protein [Microlunatus sagamiharensis]SDU86878.1 ribonuclease D [Microlunatus sagamiharensis]